MGDPNTGSVISSSDLGTVAAHPLRVIHPLCVAPSTEGELNTFSLDIVPVACMALTDILFEFDSSFVLPDAANVLADLPGLREKHKNAKGELPPLSIFGHADPVGTDIYNKTLSGRRAMAIYGLLTHDVTIWDAELYDKPFQGDNWQNKNAVASMKKALGPSAPSGHKDVIKAYIELICPFKLEKKDFLGQGADPKGKADYLGCGEFNPLLLLTKDEDKNLPKEKRNEENQPNRRVVIYLFRPGDKVDAKTWPCPEPLEPPANCIVRFFVTPVKGDDRRKLGPARREHSKLKDTEKDTFACRFYDRIAHVSPCEGGVVPPRLVELVEVVTQDEEKWVEGAGDATTLITNKVIRKNTDKDSAGNFLQLVNLNRDLEMQNKRHPEYGRTLEFKARVEKMGSLAGLKVYFSYDLTKGTGRPAAMSNGEEEAFDGGTAIVGKAAQVFAVTDDKGWASIKLKLSMFGGDKFTLSAALDDAMTKSKRTTKTYIVWRRIWYQITKGKAPAKAIHDPTAKVKEFYGRVFVNVLDAASSCNVEFTKVEFDKAASATHASATSANTFYPEYMCVANSASNTDVLLVGAHNEKAMWTFFKTAVTEPVKMHYMMCHGQWDPGGVSNAISKIINVSPDALTHVRTTRANGVTASGTIIKPYLKRSQKLVVNGIWTAFNGLGAQIGGGHAMTDDFIEIPTNRAGALNDFDLVLPAAVTNEFAVGKSLVTAARIRCAFKLRTAGVYLGDCNGHHITVDAFERADRKKGNIVSTVCHETGHSFHQAPNYGTAPNYNTGNSANLPKSFSAGEKGTLKVWRHFGWHCYNGATANGAEWENGTCTMATLSTIENRPYCSLCAPFVCLQNMSAPNAPSRT